MADVLLPGAGAVLLGAVQPPLLPAEAVISFLHFSSTFSSELESFLA